MYIQLGGVERKNKWYVRRTMPIWKNIPFQLLGWLASGCQSEMAHNYLEILHLPDIISNTYA
jgi:hypothetical protein